MAEKAEVETTENNMTSRDSNGHSEPHSDHSIEMPSDPERQQIVTAVKGDLYRYLIKRAKKNYYRV